MKSIESTRMPLRQSVGRGFSAFHNVSHVPVGPKREKASKIANLRGKDTACTGCSCTGASASCRSVTSGDWLAITRARRRCEATMQVEQQTITTNAAEIAIARDVPLPQAALSSLTLKGF